MNLQRGAGALSIHVLIFLLLCTTGLWSAAIIPSTWEKVALLHFKRYPGMEAADLYKLVAQGISGPRHLLGDPNAAWQYLQREWVEVEPGGEPMCEPISPGGKVLRIHLAPFKARGLSPASLFAAMRESAEEIRGTASEFAAVWQRLRRMAGQGWLPVASAEMVRLAGMPFDPLAWTQHSAAFDRLYRPHYRVVTQEAFGRHFPGINPGDKLPGLDE